MIEQKTEELVQDLRNAGLYEDKMAIPDPERPLVVLTMFLGDVAFAPRTQAPEQREFDEAFSALTRQLQAEEANEIARKMIKGDWDD